MLVRRKSGYACNLQEVAEEAVERGCAANIIGSTRKAGGQMPTTGYLGRMPSEQSQAFGWSHCDGYHRPQSLVPLEHSARETAFNGVPGDAGVRSPDSVVFACAPPPPTSQVGAGDSSSGQ